MVTDEFTWVIGRLSLGQDLITVRLSLGSEPFETALNH